jgi:signal recognition particle subunit SRP72
MSSLAALLKNTRLDSPEDVLKTANEALKKSKGDISAQHVKVVALLKLERYEDALKAFDSDKLKSEAPLEYAYTLYRCNKLEDAQKVAKGKDNRGLLHVAAQSSYRLEDFDSSSQIYKQLGASESDESYDLRINSSAVDAQLEWSGSGDRAIIKKTQREDLDAFESAYNAACGCIARGELSQAGILLNRAKRTYFHNQPGFQC